MSFQSQQVDGTITVSIEIKIFEYRRIRTLQPPLTGLMISGDCLYMLRTTGRDRQFSRRLWGIGFATCATTSRKDHFQLHQAEVDPSGLHACLWIQNLEALK